MVFEAFLASAKIVRRPVEAGSVVEGLGALMRDWLETALGTLGDKKKRVKLALTLHLGKFDRDASRYHSAVYQRKRLDLVASLHASLSPLFLGQLKNLHKIETAKFSRDIVAGVKEPGYDFGTIVEEGKKGARERFMAGAKGSCVVLLSPVTRCLMIIQRSEWRTPTGNMNMSLLC